MSGNLSDVPVVLKPDMRMTPKTMSATFYQELDSDFDGFSGAAFSGHTLLGQFSFEEAWSTWEVHPAGDELVYQVSGDTDLTYIEAGASKTVRLKAPGDYVVVPKGCWHTASPHEPTTCLFVTPGEGTMNALTPGGDPL